MLAVSGSHTPLWKTDGDFGTTLTRLVDCGEHRHHHKDDDDDEDQRNEENED
jgi:hypothetical protein